MADCALVDRDSSQIDCPQSDCAGAGSDDRTRKRARGEAPEDYAKRDAFKAARGTREYGAHVLRTFGLIELEASL